MLFRSGWISAAVNPSGRRSVLFSPAGAIPHKQVQVPCGQCIGCRLERSRQWAVRIVHEAQMHERNCFITLTYDNAHYPVNGSLDVRHFQLFMKRLRKAYGAGIRFFHCGEYGEELGRPHYHALLFGLDFMDRRMVNGSGVARSEELSKLWTDGFSTVGTVTPSSAQYVAQYCTKIVTGKKKAEWYGDRLPEFAIMSRRPGLGMGWLEKYGDVLFERDFVVVDGGKKLPIPRFYLDKFPVDVLEEVKLKRKQKMDNHPDSRGSRAIARAECAYRKVTDGKRGYENG